MIVGHRGRQAKKRQTESRKRIGDRTDPRGMPLLLGVNYKP